MAKKMNKGVSMVEIAIALAIFAILLIPIVSGIISAMKSSTNSKETQYRNEYAENIMEYVKTASIEDLIKGDYFVQNGSTAFTATKVSDQLYKLTGFVKLGTEHTEYQYEVQLDTDYYSNAAAQPPSVDTNGDGVIDDKDATFIDPNDIALGIVEDMDHTKVALIDGTLANYDTAVTGAFQTRIVQKMKDADPERYKQYISQQLGYQFNDNVKRAITIEVKGKASKGFDVTAYLDYVDNDSLLGGTFTTVTDDNHIRYCIYPTQHFDNMTNVYLMYNPCRYNDTYIADDYILFDTTGIEDDTQVSVFVVESAEQYSSNIKSTLDNRTDGKQIGDIGNDATRIAGTSAISRDDVTVHMAGMIKGSEIGGQYGSLNKLKVYHNLYNTVNADGTQNSNHKSEKLNYTEKNGSVTSVDAFLTALQTYLASGNRYVALQKEGADGKVVAAKSAEVDYINKAEQEQRGLYRVRIWINKASDGIDTSKDPILTGTKGGNES